MPASLQDALARLDALAEEWSTFSDNLGAADFASFESALLRAIMDFISSVSAEVAAIRAAHSLPCSAASSAAPPADAPPCSAGLTAGASSDAPAISRGADRAVDFTPGEPLT